MKPPCSAAVSIRCSGQVDEVVVVDTGSVDATPSIAASYGARLLHFDWTEDFSAARNYALDAATGGWILYIDADERLAPEAGPLRDTVSATGHAGFRLKFRPKLGYSPYAELRLFRSDPRIRFEGRMHEQITLSVQRVCESDGLRVGRSDALIQHLGYEGDQTHKHERNLPLLVRAVEDDPDRIYLRWHLGETLAAVGDDEAPATLRGAIDAAYQNGRPASRAEAVLAVHALARLHLEAGEAQQADAVLDEGLALRSGDPALLLLKGRALIDLGRESNALSFLSTLPLDDPEFLLYSRGGLRPAHLRRMGL